MFKKVNIDDVKKSATKLIGKDWMLLTAGNEECFNTMTASWGGIGVLWYKPIVIIFVRPTRYTYEFLEKEDYFTASFFDEKHRSALHICGAVSGRKVDKMQETGLTPVASEHGNVYFNEAKMVIECKKIYFGDLNPDNFIDSKVDEFYPHKDYHRMYIGEIVNVFSKE